MMLEWLGEYEAARHIENAVEKVLSEGKVKTYDLGGTAMTSDMECVIIEEILGG